MAIFEDLTEEECYLWAILSDPSGLDQAEFSWTDSEKPDHCFRAWPFQWSWWRDTSRLQIDQAARCLKVGQLVLTSEGWKPIEQVQVGDLVLTHKNRWRRVLGSFDRGIKHTVAIRGHGQPSPLIATPDHKFWMRHVVRASKNKDGHKGKKFLPAEWISIEDWKPNDGSGQMASNWSAPAEVEPLPYQRWVDKAYKSGQQNYVSDILDLDWLWLYGLFLAEGSTYLDDQFARITWSVHENEVDYVTSVLECVGLNYYLDKCSPDKCVRIQVNSRPMVSWLRSVTGNSCYTKFIAPWVFGLDEKYRRAVFEGMTYGDGWIRENGRISYTTTSKRLAYDLRILSNSLGYSFSCTLRPPGETVIKGRKVRTSLAYCIEMQEVSTQKRARCTLMDGHAWSPIYSVTDNGVEHVWDLEVEDDNSFICEGIVVHNSVGKSLSIKVRAYAFPFIHPGQEMVVTAPEGNHLDAITDVIETAFLNNRLGREMLVTGRTGIKHRPFHCIAEGQMVLTDRGHIPIEDVQVGDLVWTHRNRWRPVTAVWDQGEREVVSISGKGHFGLTVTPDHKIYSRHVRRTPASRGVKYGKLYDDPEFTAVQDWRLPDGKRQLHTHWASPTSVDSPVPLPKKFRLNNQGFGVGRGREIDPTSPEFMYFLGLYMAEGCTWRGQLTVLTCHESEVTYITGKLDDLGINYSVRAAHGKAVDIRIANSALASWIESMIPGGSRNKDIPVWVFGLPEESREAFLQGYMFGDGHLNKKNQAIRIVTTSRALACSTKLLALSLGYNVSFFYRPALKKVSVLRGREIKTGDSYEIYVDILRTKRAHNHSEVLDDGHMWAAAGKKLTEAGTAHVYDLTVEDDHSFLVDGIFVSNCNFQNGSRIMGRIPQRDGKGVKGCTFIHEYVLTCNGYKQAKDVVVGDEVLTHTGQWKKVTAVYHDINDCYEVHGAGSFPLTVSCDHRFYGAVNNATPKQKRDFGPLTFQDVEFLLEDQFYWATPTKFPHVDPIYPREGNTSKSYDYESEDFWWLAGLYVADGYVRGGFEDGKPYLSAINWISHPENKGRKKLLRALEALGCNYRISKRSHSTGDQVEVTSRRIAEWAAEQFGRSAATKTLPVFILSLPDHFKEAFLDGYLSGDGHWNAKKSRWECSSASKTLMLMIQLVAQSLGYAVNCTSVKPKVTHVNGVELKKEPETSWRLHISENGHAYRIGDYFVNKVKKVIPVGKQPIVDIRVEEDHSYLSGSIMSHNIHPVWLEMDESQDYPAAGWMEIIETLKQGTEGSMWRAHGVTRGLRDHFYQYTQPGSGWRVHRITAMHRPYPYWSDEERQGKIQMYGSRDHPDYRRNVLGLHGDATNPLFVLHRLMSCVDMDVTSDYNQYEYTKLKINNEMILDYNDEVVPLLQLPESHKRYQGKTWIGMDVGFTTAPSAILVFGEEKAAAKGDPVRLRLLTKLMLERVSNPHQVQIILWLIAFYRPHAFAMDKTGNGLPMFQDIQYLAERNKDYRSVLDIIKGYNFSSKILVDFDQSVTVDEFRGDPIKDAGVFRNVLEYSSDKLRQLVDERRIQLPFDHDLISEFQGQTWTYKTDMDQYGRKKNYSSGEFHVLDAAKMAVLGFSQFAIEAVVKKEETHAPVTDIFFL